MARENAGNDVDPGVIAQAQAMNRRAAVAKELGLKPGQPSGRLIPARGPKSPVGVDELSAQQPQSIPGAQGAWMGPLDPLVPTAPGAVRGRAFDYMVGWNITTNNSRMGQASAIELRNLARTCGLVATAINKRKNHLEQGSFDFKLVGDRTGFKSVKDQRIQELREFFAFPDKRLPLARWIRKWTDDLFILDSPCIWTQRNRAGKPYLMRVIDSATIKPLIDADGERPLPPAPAYQQWLKGVPATDYSNGAGADAQFTADDLLWHPRNPRPDTTFGYSPVESIYVEVNLAIRRTLMVLAGYTAGTVPEALIPVPPDWKMEDITAFQVYWESILMGQDAARRGVRFVPNGLDKAVFTKKWEDHAKFDEWLARFVSFAFDLPPTPWVETNNRATAEQAAASSDDEGRIPYLGYVCEVLNILVWKNWHYLDIEAVFRERNTSNEVQAATAAKIRVASGLTSVDEERGDAGRDAVGQGPVFLTATGPIPLGDAAKSAEGQQQLEATTGKKPSDPPESKVEPIQDTEKMAKVVEAVLAKLDARKKKLY